MAFPEMAFPKKIKRRKNFPYTPKGYVPRRGKGYYPYGEKSLRILPLRDITPYLLPKKSLSLTRRKVSPYPEKSLPSGV